MESWQNSMPDFGAAAFCTIKIDDFRGYISDDRPSNDRTTDYRPHIIALFLIALCNPTSLFHRTVVTDSRSRAGRVYCQAQSQSIQFQLC